MRTFSSPDIIVKVGGSLYDLPNLGDRLAQWLDELKSTYLVAPGGGAIVESLRDLDQCHGLGEEASHWLALRLLTVQAHFLASIITKGAVVDDQKSFAKAWDKQQKPILDALAFAFADEASEDHLPHCWQATSDSIAARVAKVFGAKEVILLKSVDIAAEVTREEAAKLGYVDSLFSSTLGSAIQTRFINFRRWATKT
jgi:5-(aminomethyl)-3-furanmethanol phosphate kinase